MDLDEPSAHGWDAIDAACQALYGDQAPKHVGYAPGRAFGSVLQGCSAYWAGDHWHYVTFGLTNIFDEDEGANDGYSGWGYELTMRVTDRSAPQGSAPEWPFTILQRIATWAHDKPLLLEPAVRLPLNQPVTGYPHTGGPDTTLTVLAIVDDPTLGTIDSVNGTVSFLQLVGVTEADWEEMKGEGNESVMLRLAANNPLHVTAVG